MKLTTQAAIVFGIGIAGMGISTLLPVPIPGRIIGLISLFLLMMGKILRSSHVQGIGSVLLDHMTLFFIPPCVAIIEYVGLVGPILPKLLMEVVARTLITFLSTASTVKLVVRSMRGRSDGQTLGNEAIKS